jgi:DNA-binding response OmpR family regulator
VLTSLKLPYRILVLDDDPHALDGIAELLRDGGYEVTPVADYLAAKQQLHENRFDLLVSDVRVRSFNGLHLVMQCRREHPDMALMIMTGYDDALMQIEAGRYNAAFVRKPIEPTEFLRSVTTCLGNVRRQRRWPRKRVVGGFRVTVAGHPAAVIDVGYGGLRLEMPAVDTLPQTFSVEVTGIGLNLEVEPVWWSRATRGNAVICGAALASDSTPAARTWRTIVDRLTA